MYMLNFIYLSVDRHLGYLHLLATVNIAAMSVSMQVSVWGLFSTPGFMPSPEMAGSHCNSVISFGGTTNLFSTVAASFHLQTSNVEGVSISISLPTCYFLSYSPLSKCDVLSRCGFDSHFPSSLWCWATFHVLIGHLYIFGEMSKSFAHFLIGLLAFFVEW